jgi:glycosyltransferase involved in cell wall biosynthesis
MKKIISISLSYEKGGAEISLKNLLKKLAQRKYKIYLLTSKKLIDFFEIPKIEKLAIPFNSSMKIFKKLNGIKFINFYAILKRIFIFIKYSLIIKKIVKKEKIKNIHINDYKGAPFIPILKKLTKSKIIWHIRDLFALESRIKKIYYKFFGKFSDVLIAISPVVEKMLRDIGFKNVKMIYNIIELKEENISKIEARKILNLKEDKFIIGYIGRISEEKEIENLFIALKDLKNEIKNFFCLIAGEDFKGGEEKNRLIKKVKELNLEEYVKFFEWEKNPKNYYISLDLFVHPREKTFEPLGRNVIEAMFYGIPLCVSEKFSWLIEDKKNGFIFNKNSLSKKILEIYKEREYLKIISENEKRFFKEKFNNEKIVSEFISILK